MNKDNSLIKLDDVESVTEFLKQPGTKMAELLTGILVSDSKAWKLSAGHLIQASIKWKLFSQLGKEIKDYVEKGKIKEYFLDTEQHKQSLSDLLKFIDEESPEEDRFTAMKSLFIKSVCIDSSEEEQILSYQFMKLCKELESGHLLILKAAYNIKNGNYNNKLSSTEVELKNDSANKWFINISLQIGHGIKSLVEVHEDKLMHLKLIGQRRHTDKSGVANIENYRLTDLGCKICEYIFSK